MAAIQRMRKRAQEKGALSSNEQQKVEVQVVESKQVIVIEQANPEVIYVPSYDPVYVYGPAVWPYPAIYYPPYYGSVVHSCGDLFWNRIHNGFLLGWRLGMGLWLGRR
jgi:hypothetical protein